MWKHRRPSSWMRLEQVSDEGPDQNISSNSLPLTSPSEGETSQSSNLKSFSFKELKTATKKFSNNHFLGQGALGRVFNGWIDEHKLTATKPGKGTAVAVKILDRKSIDHKEWLATINHLGKLYHPNLVKLLGHCSDQEERLLLVSEFMPQGSLYNHLFRRDSNCQLSWSLRLKIALETAKALAFLHSAEINVIHRGLTSSNILLDSDYNAKLSDFGLAKGGRTGERTCVTELLRSTGYHAPEYLMAGQSTAKSDVYGFGVVLLELLSGRKADRPSDVERLVECAQPYLNDKRKIVHFLDSHLECQYSLENAQMAACLALQCISKEAKLRPNMDVVVSTLEQLGTHFSSD